MDPSDLRYDCELAALPTGLSSRFVQLRPDAETQAFVERAEQARHGRLKTGAFALLRRFMSDYNAYGRLGMYRLHLLGPSQWQQLLGLSAGEARAGAFLDVGAGRGDATAGLGPHYPRRVAIEPARSLHGALRARGFAVLDVDLCAAPVPSRECFELITCLNVIDRVAHPKTLLRHAIAALAPAGRLVLSVPVPLRPHVDSGAGTVSQEEPLPRPAGDGFEAQVATLELAFLRPLGLMVTHLSRAPYVSQGDADAPLYVLDDALFVCERGK